MIKICHVTSVHDTTDIRIFQKECVSLAKNQTYEVCLVGPGIGTRVEQNVKIIGAGEKPQSRKERMIGYSKKVMCKAIEQNADIYHLHDPELILYAKKLKNSGKHVIFDSHELYTDQIMNKTYIPIFLRYVISKAYRFIENRACHYFDAVIFPCKIDGKHPFYGRAKKCEFINNYPMLKELDQFDNGLVEKTDSVCCAGGLTKDRGIEVLIKACYKAQVKLILAGEFSPKEFKKEIMSSKEFSIVDYRGKCHRSEVYEIYKEASIGISNILHTGQYPTLFNLPTKVYEYMMMSLPFIISDFDYAKEVIDEYKCGIVVKPDNIDDIKDAILYLIDNKDKAREMGENGRKAIEKEFNWEKESIKLLDLYKSILEH